MSNGVVKLGFRLRRIATRISLLIREILGKFLYFSWLLLDPSKFKIIHNKKIKSILVVFDGAVGDTYNILGMINSLLEKYDYLSLYYLTTEKNKSFVKNPRIKVVNLDETKKLIDNKKIDSAVILDGMFNPELFDWEFYKKILKVQYRVGLSSSGLSSFFRIIPFSYTRRIYQDGKSPYKHCIAAFEKLGFYFNEEIKFYFTPDAEKYAKNFIKQHKIKSNEKVIFMHPTSKRSAQCAKEGGQSSKDWPYQRWAELANILIKKYNVRVVFTGTTKETPIIKDIISKVENKKKVIDSAGKLSIEQIASLLKKADLLICLDTAVTHIGEQAGVPIILLIGNDPLDCCPWVNKRIALVHPEVCYDCRRDICPEGDNICMKTIKVQEVLDAASKILK